MAEGVKWKYCVAGNIAKMRLDDNGVVRYGTPAYAGGTKVYLRGRYWDSSQKTITVIGLSRGKRYQVCDVPVELIENVRFQKTYKPAVLSVMENWEFSDCWWHCSAEDRDDARRFLQEWNACHEKDKDNGSRR